MFFHTGPCAPIDWEAIQRNFPFAQKALALRDKEFARLIEAKLDSSASYRAMCWQCGQYVKHELEEQQYTRACRALHPVAPTIRLEDIQKGGLSPMEEGGLRCHNCGSENTLRFGKMGAFWGCTNYPSCPRCRTAGLKAVPSKNK